MKPSQIRIANNKNNLLYAGVAGPALFIIVFTIAGAARANYDSMTYPISALSLGRYGWIQITGFIVTGMSILLFAFAVRRAIADRTLPWLIACVAIGLIAAGVFSIDSITSFDQTRPLILTTSLHGHLHEMFSLLVFICLPLSALILAKTVFKGQFGWQLCSLVTAVVMLAAFLVSGFAFKGIINIGDCAGLLQRLSVASGFTYLISIALYLLSTSR